jgi:hypothetical protein
MQTAPQTDETRLVGADHKTRPGWRELTNFTHSDSRHVDRAHDVDLGFIDLVNQLNEVFPHVFHQRSRL